MKRRIHRSDEELLPADRAVCLTKNGAYPTVLLSAVSINAVVRLRKKACQIPERIQNAERIIRPKVHCFCSVEGAATESKLF